MVPVRVVPSPGPALAARPKQIHRRRNHRGQCVDEDCNCCASEHSLSKLAHLGFNLLAYAAPYSQKPVPTNPVSDGRQAQSTEQDQKQTRLDIQDAYGFGGIAGSFDTQALAQNAKCPQEAASRRQKQWGRRCHRNH